MKWIFDREPASGVRTGGGVADHLFPRSIDSFVRETTQNSNDQRRFKDRPVVVKFSLHNLSGDFANEFLNCIGWADLSRHLQGAKETQSLSRSRIERALQSAENPDAGFNVLVLSDHNTFGLYGDERASEPNFANLVRHVLMTSDGQASRGGTYGLGKSVLWAFSDISSVLFHSRPTLKPGPDGRAVPDPEGSRFIGRASLVSHSVGAEDFDPNGLFGELVVDDQNREWSRSVRGESAEEVLPQWLLRLRSSSEDTGTSVIIPFFGAPGRTGPEVSTEEMCDAITAALNVWYWPAIQSNQLAAEVSQYDNDALIRTTNADGKTGVDKFVAAWSSSRDVLVEVAKEDGQVVERDVEVVAPKTTSQVHLDHQHNRVSAEARLRVIRVEDSNTPRIGTVALVRGAGMVVRYLKPPALGVDVPSFVGVLEAGMRYPTPTPEHENVERFLKAAEPYAHDDWVHNTDRVAQDYIPGAGAALTGMKERISSAIREALKANAGDNEDGPASLSKRFNLTGDGPDPSSRLTIKDVEYDSSNLFWSLEVTMTLARKTDIGPWVFTGSVEVDNRFGKSESLIILSATALSPMGAVCVLPSREIFECNVPEKSRQVTLRLKVDATASVVPAIMRERVALAAVAQIRTSGL